MSIRSIFNKLRVAECPEALRGLNDVEKMLIQQAKIFQNLYRLNTVQIELFPDEVLLDIFQRLSIRDRLNAAQTCKRWQRLLRDPRSYTERVQDITLRKKVPQIQLDDHQINNITIFANVASYIGQCKRLCLDFSMGDGSDEESEDSDDENADAAIDTDQVIRIFDVLNRGILHATECVQLKVTSSQTLNSILPFLPTLLKYLRITAPSGRSVELSELPETLELEKLTLDNVSASHSLEMPADLKSLYYYPDGDSDFAIFMSGIQNCVRLEELHILDLSFAGYVYQYLPTFISDHLNHLRLLRLGRIRFPHSENIVVHEFMRPFRESGEPIFPSLETLELESCAFVPWPLVEVIVKTAPSLKVLKFDTANSWNEDLSSLFKGLVPLLHARGIKLEVILSRYQDQEPGQDRIHLAPPLPAALCHVLTRLILSNVPEAGQILDTILDCGQLDRLTQLIINCQTTITDQVLEKLATNCLYLKNLVLYECKCTEHGLTSFLRHWNERKSNQLTVSCVWPGPDNPMNLDAFCGLFMPERVILPDGKRLCVMKKSQTKSIGKRRMIIWEPSKKGSEKMLIIKDYWKVGMYDDSFLNFSI